MSHQILGSIFTRLPHLDFLAVFFVDLAGSAFFSFLAFSDATNSSNAWKSASRGTLAASDKAPICFLRAAGQRSRRVLVAHLLLPAYAAHRHE